MNIRCFYLVLIEEIKAEITLLISLSLSFKKISHHTKDVHVFLKVIAIIKSTLGSYKVLE